VVVANPADDVLGLDFISQPDPSGNFKPDQLLPGLEQQLSARMEELPWASGAPFTLKAYGRSFLSFLVIYAKSLPSMVELGWILEAGDPVPRQMDAILEAGDCAPRQPWVDNLQRQRDPTKGKRLWLVLDGCVLLEP